MPAAQADLGRRLGRIVNGAVFAGMAVGASRLVKDPLKLRQMMASGLAVAASTVHTASVRCEKGSHTIR